MIKIYYNNLKLKNKNKIYNVNLKYFNIKINKNIKL